MMVPVEPHALVRADYHGTVKAPYYKFEKSPRFYRPMSLGGTFAGYLQGCPWRCENCWSDYGKVGEKVSRELEPGEVVATLLRWMEHNEVGAGRITGGDVAWWWDHVHAVVREFVKETSDERGAFVLPAKNGRRVKVPYQLVIETSGGIGKMAENVLELERELGEQARRIIVSVGMKATSVEGLAALTGQEPATARASHRRQWQLLDALIDECEHLRFAVTFLDGEIRGVPLTDRAAVAALEARLPAEDPGVPHVTLAHRGGVSVYPLTPYSTKRSSRGRPPRRKRNR